MKMGTGKARPLLWVGSSRRDIRDLPPTIQDEFGHALWLAQIGDKHESAKPLKGLGGAGVLEVVESDRAGTYRAIYTVRFSGMIYVLHVFQKKSVRGIKTAELDINLIRRRLQWAEEHYQEYKHDY